jgi:hypothetical protein
MIEKFYAAHIKNVLDASAINVMRSKSQKRPAHMPEIPSLDVPLLEGPEEEQRQAS